jgi:DtxR family transcriptional regulator, Mn-dependent transcriptional regulator
MEVEQHNVTTNSIAQLMGIKPSAVTDMLRKMSDKQLINYEKYQGVTLTEKGKKAALLVIRKHRLWEVFLVKTLEFKWDEVHEVAEQLEHVNSDQLIERLDKFLNYPNIDPHGDLIPNKDGVFLKTSYRKLSTVKRGEVELMRIEDTSLNFLGYLDKIGLTIGSKIEVVEVFEYDNSLSITIEGGKQISVSLKVAQNLLVERKGGD